MSNCALYFHFLIQKSVKFFAFILNLSTLCGPIINFVHNHAEWLDQVLTDAKPHGPIFCSRILTVRNHHDVIIYGETF